MRKLIEMPYGDKDTILIEVDVPEEEIEEKRKVGVLDIFKKEPEKVDMDFTILSQMLVKCSKPIVEALEMLGNEKFPPQKASAEFGLKFSSKGNIYLVEASGEASITINFEWDLGPKS